MKSHEENTTQKTILCDKADEAQKAQILNSVVCLTGKHPSWNFECEKHSWRDTNSYWRLESDIRRSVKWGKVKRCYDMTIYCTRNVISRKDLEKILVKNEFLTLNMDETQVKFLKEEHNKNYVERNSPKTVVNHKLSPFVRMDNLLSKNLVNEKFSEPVKSFKNGIMKRFHLILNIIIVVITAMALKDYKVQVPTVVENEIPISKYIVYSLCWLIIVTISLLCLYFIIH